MSSGKGEIMLRGQFPVPKYIQGPGAVAECGRYLPVNCSSILLVADSLVMSLIHDDLVAGARSVDVSITPFEFGGECSESEIERARTAAVLSKASAVAGAGGGKAIDTGRMVAHLLGLPIITIPTIAATNAACSSLVGVYSEDHVYKYPVKTGRVPDLVVADTAIIAQAPVRSLVAGMGDVLTGKYEGQAMRLAGKETVHGTVPSETANRLSILAHDIVLEKGFLAKLSAQHKRPTPALEDVVEAILFLSEAGAEGGGGTAVAHGLHSGLSVVPETRTFYHGEKVAFCLIAQLVLENRTTEEIRRIQSFCLKVGLPVTLAQIGITERVEEQLCAVVTKASEPNSYVHNMPFTVEKDALLGAILIADTLGHELLFSQ